MASIRKLVNGKFEVQIRRRGFPSVCRNFHNKKDAQEWARFMEAKADRGDMPAPLKSLERHKVRDVIERYRDEVSVKKKSHNTEIFILNAFLRQPMAEYRIARISASDFSRYREDRLKAVKPGTVNRELAIIKHAFDIAMREWDMPLKENPLSKVNKLKVNNSRTRRLLPDEYEALQTGIAKTRNSHVMPLILFAIETAMRRGELLRLTWQDIDFEKRTLFIPVTKNGYSRTIPLTKAAITILIELQEGAQEEQRVFPLTSNSVRMAWDRLVSRAKITNLHFHDLRHEAISRFFEKGLSVPEVALISGHRDYRMLFRYTHLQAEDIANKLN